MNLLLGLFLLSGAAGLIGQVLWVRLFTLIFGSTTVSVATVTAIFLGGLAFGAYEGGVWGREARRPVLWYGWLEIGVAIWAAGVPWAARAFESGLMDLADVVTLSPLMVGMLRAALAMVLVGPPAAAMGATLPLLAAASPRGDKGPNARWVGRLYGWNTVGAVAGTLAAGYLLIPSLGVKGTAFTGAFLNLLAGGGALLIGRRPQDRPGGESVPEGFAQPATRGASPATATGTPVFAAMALVGAAGLGFEVAWTRALHLILGPSVYAFTAVLAVMLTGLAVGGLAGARLCAGPDESRRRLVWNLWALTAAGLAVIPLFTQLPFLFLEAYAAADGSFWVLQAGYLGLCALVLIVPAALSGSAFPLAVAAAGGPAQAGSVYAWNAAGAVAGALAVGGLAAGVISTQGVLKGLVGLVAFAAMVAAVSGDRRNHPAMLGLGLLALVTAVGAPRWPAHLLLSGVAIRPELYLEASRGEPDRRTAWLRWMLRGSVISIEEGRNAVIGVKDYGGSIRTLLVSGKPDASTAITADLRTQYLSAHIPLALHPRPQRVAIIGLGSGATAGAALAHPVREVTCFEIEPAVGAALPLFESINHGCWRDPRLAIRYGDARVQLLVAPARYDVIISEPSNPWMSGPSRLFTREFYSLIRRRLAADGVFCQWLQLYRLSTEDLLMELRTVLSEFPEASLWVTSLGDTLVIAGPEWLAPSYRLFALRLGQGAARTDLERIRMAGPESVLARCVLWGEPLRRAAGEGSLNTDDRPRLEYGAPRTLYNEEAIDRHRMMLASWWTGLGGRLAGLPRGAADEERAWLRLSRAYAEQGLAKPAAQAAEAALKACPESARPLNELGYLALLRGQAAEAARYLEAATARGTPGWRRQDEAVLRANLAEAYVRLGRRREARRVLEAARRRAPDSAIVQHNLGWLLFLEGDVPAAEAALRAAIRLAPEDPKPRVSWGRILLERKDPRGALEKFLEAAALAPELPEARSGILRARALLNGQAAARAGGAEGGPW